jgi:hypothetical protein
MSDGERLATSVYGLARTKELAADCAADAQSAVPQFGEKSSVFQLLQLLMFDRER